MHTPSASQVGIVDEYWAILCEFHPPSTQAVLFHPGIKNNPQLIYFIYFPPTKSIASITGDIHNVIQNIQSPQKIQNKNKKLRKIHMLLNTTHIAICENDLIY